MSDIMLLNLINFGEGLHQIDIEKDTTSDSLSSRFQSFIMYKQEKIKLELKQLTEICN
jgi:hypothetical protein